MDTQSDSDKGLMPDDYVKFEMISTNFDHSISLNYEDEHFDNF